MARACSSPSISARLRSFRISTAFAASQHNRFEALRDPVHDRAIVDTGHLEESDYINDWSATIGRYGLAQAAASAHPEAVLVRNC